MVQRRGRVKAVGGLEHRDLADQNVHSDAISDETNEKPLPVDPVVEAEASAQVADPPQAEHGLPLGIQPHSGMAVKCKSLPPELVAFILPKRGVSPEETEAFADLQRRVTDILTASDVIDQFLISRIVNLMWDCSSVSRYLNRFLMNARERSMMKLLDGRVSNFRELVEAVRKGDQKAIDKAREIMSEAGLGEEDIHAQSFITHLDVIERLKKIEMPALKEINRLWRELDYRKMVREQVRLRQLYLSLREAHFRKYGVDIEMEIPK